MDDTEPKGVQIFPDYQVRAHITRLMATAYGSGALCPVSINVAKARTLLNDMRLDELLATDATDIIASIDLARSKGKTWAPWHLTEILARKRADAYRRGKEQAAKDAKQCPITPKMPMNEEAGKRDWAYKLMCKHTAAQRARMIRWAMTQPNVRKMKASRAYWAYMVLADWKAKRA